MPLIQMTAISSRDLSNAPKRLLQQTRIRAKKGLKKWIKRFRQEYMKTVASWNTESHPHPKFEIEFESTQEGEEATVSTDNEIYRFLHDGTEVRWAIMSDPFEPKTKRRWLGSGPGVGKAVLKGRTAMAAHGIQTAQDGIEAREWTQEILRVHEKSFQDDMDKIVFGDFK